MATHEVEIVALVVSAVHAYEGRPADGPRPDPEPLLRQEITVRAGRGLVGDRYFNRPAHRQAAVTVFDAAAVDEWGADPVLTRRNIILRGFTVDSLARTRGAKAGAVFALDSGSGPVRFQANRPANPCAWMDVVVAPGAFRGLRGRGGVRCTPLDDGVLRTGAATLTVLSAVRAGSDGGRR
ncbi:molybdenum cofactor biosysynthesis protein [Amycolatopsis sp. K13G38]|uniref:Molybdenum cofactor biosysynthesis protein n=1 Tax=Amycolatopsis acididurans TaxID=2724524 RepID=A0ABX1J2G0_9PSEU|nr:molybdenum cofactor biosysynthesis protein [Amycolatopsis acididurans]NKQ53982.1 molybdenum cofactor biosysynthesis protein [Amycolatopsis acididurans]